MALMSSYLYLVSVLVSELSSICLDAMTGILRSSDVILDSHCLLSLEYSVQSLLSNSPKLTIEMLHYYGEDSIIHHKPFAIARKLMPTIHDT